VGAGWVGSRGRMDCGGWDGGCSWGTGRKGGFG
jgi:hypothetical protein